MKAAVFRSYGAPEVLRIEDIDPHSRQAGHSERVLIGVHSDRARLCHLAAARRPQGRPNASERHS